MTKKTKITDVRSQASCRLYPEEKMAFDEKMKARRENQQDVLRNFILKYIKL